MVARTVLVLFVLFAMNTSGAVGADDPVIQPTLYQLGTDEDSKKEASVIIGDWIMMTVSGPSGQVGDPTVQIRGAFVEKFQVLRVAPPVIDGQPAIGAETYAVIVKASAVGKSRVTVTLESDTIDDIVNQFNITVQEVVAD